MATFFIQLGMMSAQASVAILVVLVLRKVFALLGVSKKYTMLLWMIPFWLLICPWKLSSPVGFWNTAPSDYNEAYAEQVIEQWQGNSQVMDTVQSGLSAEEIGGNGVENIGGQFVPGEENAATEYTPISQDGWGIRNVLQVAEIIWAAGVMALFLYTGISYVILLKKVQCCIQVTEGVYCVDELPVPMVLGWIRPKIYLPSGVAAECIPYVIEHEKTHIRRKDTVVKLTAYIVVCIHWFNPLVWLAYHLLEKDMEMACDEETIGRIGVEEKKQYATALLQLSTGEHRIFAMPLAFGEGDTKGRIKNVMHYKKTVKIVAICAVMLGLLVLAVFMTKNEDKSEGTADTGNVLTFKLLQEIEKNDTWESTDFFAFENHEREEGALISFRELEYNEERYILLVSYDEALSEVEMVRIMRYSNGDGTTLFSSKGGFSESLEDFFAGKINIGYWLDVDLPEGYVLKDAAISERQEGSALIVPQAYELYSDNLYASEQWYHAGAIGRLPSGGSYFTFEDGRLKELNEELWNSSNEEYLGVFDFDWQALMMRYEYPLYMQEALIELENQGEVDMSNVETTSDYWYFYFAEEGEHEAYYLSLSTKLFSKEEAIAIAKTVDIKKNNYQSQMQQKELTFDRVREAAANHTLHKLDFHSYANGTEYYFDSEYAVNYYINFYYDHEGEVYKLETSHWLENGVLESIYISRESDGEMRWIYRDEDGVDEYSDYLEPLLATKESVDAWLSIELPEGYTLDSYQAYRGWAGGALILPQSYELYGEDVFAPEEWYHAGFIGQIPYATDVFIFENGKLVDGAINQWNHSTCERLEVLDLDWQTLLVHINHDLYTAAGQAWLEEDGVDIAQIDTTSDYWYFFFAKEGEDTAYYLSLSQKEFTKEEAIAIAKTVDIRD
ncbi:MAG: hypothetical protein IKL06_03585 [Lachnospiraceae bacterium]|nr:hypothetical protein [Lachnospiraceae bacterium]